MSTFVDLDVACPHCGTVSRQSVATSINASRTPAYREAILAESFQRFTCRACTKEVIPMLPFVYLDFDRKQFIAVFPSQNEREWWRYEDDASTSFEETLGADAPPIAREVGAGMAVRTVFGLGALREKIVALTANLDDAVIETLKLRMLLTADPPVVSDPPPRLVEVHPETLVFTVGRRWAGDEVEPGPLVVPRAEYDAVATDPDLAALREALAEGPYRDVRVLEAPAGRAR